MDERLHRLAREVLPLGTRRFLSLLGQGKVPPGFVRFGSLRRTSPVSVHFGEDRGRAIDRHYIEKHVRENARFIRGTVLEIGAALYGPRFGGDRVEHIEVLHVSEKLPDVTVVGDLTDGELFPEGTFDCIVLTQTLQFIYDVHGAVSNCHRFLKPGGTVIATVPGISQISRWDMDRWGQYWSFTTRSASRLFEDAFAGGAVEVSSHGNVLSSIAFLQGLALEELRTRELDHIDPDYQLLIGIRATRALES